MPGPGRNEPCPCGSGRKVKRCCGVRRGPSESQLARAFLAEQGRWAARELADVPLSERLRLWESLVDLPARDLSLLVRLPQLISPDLQRLREAMVEDDPEWGWDALTVVAKQVDTSVERRRLAEALVALRDSGRLGRREVAAALLDLDSRSTRFVAGSLLESVAVSVGVARTPGGLRLAA
jgi:SEC-C motif